MDDWPLFVARFGHASFAVQYAYAFCFAAYIISRPVAGIEDLYSFYAALGPNSGSWEGWRAWEGYRGRDSARVPRLGLMAPLWPGQHIRTPTIWPEDARQLPLVTLQGLGILVVELKVASGEVGPVQMPVTATDFPFQTFMDLPQPLGAACPGQFVYCHLAKMLTAPFIEGGRWTGVLYFERPKKCWRTLDAFTLTIIDSGTTPEIIELQSSVARMAHKTLKLTFLLRRADGIANIIVTGAQSRHNCNRWQAVLTPFGFVGTRCEDAVWLWLWKIL